MSASPIVDVAIVGASHVGTTLALALSRLAGHEITIVLLDQLDRRPAGELGSGDPRAFALSDGSRRLLEAVGVWEEVSNHAQPIRTIEVTDSALEHAVRPVLLGWDETADGQPAGWTMEAARLSAALDAAVRDSPSISSEFGVAATGLELRQESATVELTDGRRIAASLVVAADGVRSHMRQLAEMDVVAWGYAQTGIVASVAHQRPHKGNAVQHFLPGGPFAMLPLVGNRSAVTWSEEAIEARRILALGDEAFLAEIERRAGGRLGPLRLVGRKGGWPLAFQVSRSLVGRRLALVGDAARSIHPIAGQGLNLGLRDAAVLAECVTDGVRVGLDAGDGLVLERYERWRRFNAIVWGASCDALNRLFSNNSSPLRAVRDLGLGIADRLPGLQAMLMAEAAGSTGELPRLMR